MHSFGIFSALQKFRGTTEIHLDIQEMKMEQQQQAQEPKWSFAELLRAKGLRTPLIVVCALAMCQQLSGINVVCTIYCRVPVRQSLVKALMHAAITTPIKKL